MTKTFRILVTGTRLNSPLIRAVVWRTLDELVHGDLLPQGWPVVIVHGRCTKGGVDLDADQWAAERGFDREPHPADWKRHGRRAGPIRNAEMVATRPDYCIGFPAAGSQGTWVCLQKAVDAGIPTEVRVLGPTLTRDAT